MNYTTDRDINHIKEPARSRIKIWMDDRNNNHPALQIKIVEGVRSIELQKYYYNTGKSKTLKSNHLTGLAVDICFNIVGDIYLSKNPKCEYYWINLCDLANKYGLVNGFYDLNWGFDKPHFQIRECQKPIGASKGYEKAKQYKSEVKKDNLVIKKL